MEMMAPPQEALLLNDICNRTQMASASLSAALDALAPTQMGGHSASGQVGIVLGRASDLLSVMSMATELRPHAYAEVYAMLVDALRPLEVWISENAHAIAPSDLALYGLCQYFPSLLDRLYMSTLGGAIVCRNRPDLLLTILDDLLRALACMQLPVPGLFVRNFFIDSFREVIRKTHEDFRQVASLLLPNLLWATELWVRTTQRSQRDASAVPRHLSTLVSKNAALIASIPNMNADGYAKYVFPRLGRLIVNSRCALVQNDLTQAFIASLDSSWHLAVLNPFLEDILPKMEKEVPVHLLFRAYIERVSAVADGGRRAVEAAGPPPECLRDRIPTSIAHIAGGRYGACDPCHILNMLATLAEAIYRVSGPDIRSHITSLFAAAHAAVAPSSERLPSLLTQIVQLLRIPIQCAGSLEAVLTIPHYVDLLEMLQLEYRLSLIRDDLLAMIAAPPSAEALATSETLEAVFRIVQSIWCEADPQVEHLLASAVLKIDRGRPDWFESSLWACFEHWCPGVEAIRTYPGLVTAIILAFIDLLLPLLPSAADKERVINNLLRRLLPFESSDTAHLLFSLYLSITLAATEHDLGSSISFALESAIDLFERCLPSHTQRDRWMGCVETIRRAFPKLSPEARQPLVSNAARIARSMLRRPDRAIAIAACAVLGVKDAITDAQTIIAQIEGDSNPVALEVAEFALRNGQSEVAGAIADQVLETLQREPANGERDRMLRWATNIRGAAVSRGPNAAIAGERDPGEFVATPKRDDQVEQDPTVKPPSNVKD